MQPETLQYKGLPTFKQVMRNKNYLPFVPPKLHSDELYQMPSKEALALEADDKKNPRLTRNKRKKKKASMTRQLNLAVASTTEALSLQQSKQDTFCLNEHYHSI
jgi:hypothetical protein